MLYQTRLWDTSFCGSTPNNKINLFAFIVCIACCLFQSLAFAEDSRITRANITSLPTTAGQYWMEYDLKPYTQALKSVDRPQQALIDWIIRETGTDVWFNEPCGVLTADRTTLRVYHNEGMQQTVRQIYERFVNGTVDPQAYSLRVITIGNPNWRQRSLAYMRSVEVNSPGVHGWLLSKENAAMLMASLRSRSDFRETQLPDIGIVNGQTQVVDQKRSKTYVREYTRQEQPYPAYIPVSEEIQEGYRLTFSPLLTNDMRIVEASLQVSIDQVERLNNVSIDMPLANGLSQSVTINVPQVASWRLNERFKWPADQVLILSCGVIASPTSANESTLMGSGPLLNSSLMGLGKLVPTPGGSRADALLLIEYKGPAAIAAGTGTKSATPPTGVDAVPVATNPGGSSSVSRGRY